MKKLKWIHHSSRPWVTVVADDTFKIKITCKKVAKLQQHNSNWICIPCKEKHIPITEKTF